MESSDGRMAGTSGGMEGGTAASGRLPRQLIFGVLVALAVILALAGYSLWKSRENFQHGAENQAESMARLLDRYAYSAIHEADLVLQVSAEEYAHAVRTGVLETSAFSGFLENLHRRLPHILSLRATDASGLIRYGEGVDPAQPVNIADRERFQVARDKPGLAITAPIVARMSHQWVLPITRRLEGPGGRFDGVVYANIAVEHFSDLFSSLKAGRHAAILLFDANTNILIRYPEPKGPGSALGLKIGSPQFKDLWRQGVHEGTYRARSTTDGIWRTYSFRQVGDYPLYIMVGLAELDYLAPWVSEAAVIAIFVVLFGLLVAWLAYSLAGSLRARRTAFAELANSRDSLEASERRYRSVVDSIREVVFQTDIQGAWAFINPSWAEITGFSVEESLGRPVLDYVHPDDRASFQAFFQALNRGGREHGRHPIRFLSKPGGHRWLEIYARPILDAAGAVVGVSGTLDDVTERRRNEAKLQLAASVFTHAREGIMICASDGAIIDVNESFTRMTGYTRSEVLGQNPRLLRSGIHGAEFYDAMWRQLAGQDFWYGEIWNRRKNGEVFATMQTISAVRDEHGDIVQYVSLFSDITALKEHERQLEYIAHYDALTSLPNRVLLSDRLHQAMAQTLRRGERLAVAYLDLDGFKAINDNHGHKAGDQLLVAVANRMHRSLREGDTFARLGGDEFVAVLLDLNTIESSLPLLSRLLSAASQPVHLGELLLQVSASVGVTFYPQAEDVDADQLLRQADQAMYQAKLAGKNRYHIFDVEQDRHVRGHHESLDRIQLALARQEFELFYQPKVNLRSGLIVGAEALVRWRHPERGILAPDVFLPVIEDHPLAVDLGEWVIETALAQIAAWRDAGLDMQVSVNVSARQLQQPDFVDSLRAHLAAHSGARPQSLVLEVLETSALEDIAQVSQLMQSCLDIGVSFALDDFGTGYSSLTYLKRLPAAQLKIDRSFVHGMLDDPEDLAILEGVLGLAAAFRREAIAEGVETVDHGAMLLQLGCELAQGYAISRPMPAAEFPGWAQAWRTEPAWAGARHFSRDDLPLLFASVEHQAWISNIHAYLRGEREIPPAMNQHQCRFGKWLDTDGLARYGDASAYREIEALHQRVHEVAVEIVECHGRGEAQETLVKKLHALRDDLLLELRSL